MKKSDWKTKVSGLLGAVYGLSSLVLGAIMTPDPEWIVGSSEALLLIVGGFAVFGFGAKVQKLIEAVKK